MVDEKKRHFVLVHGGCHGAWCWYKVKPRLEAAGHRVSVPDLMAAGINMSRVEDILTLHDYTRPLLEVLGSLGPHEKVILVGHSLGGPSAALAADMFSSKISAAVFLTSFMPDVTHSPSYAVDKVLESIPPEAFVDTQFATYGPPEQPLVSALLGPRYLANTMYQLSPVQDLELAKTLVRVAPLITSNLAGTTRFSKEGYGSATRVFIVCGEDKAITPDKQRWIIDNFPVKEVMEIQDADHMPMFSKPKQVCDRLFQIADKYA